MLLVNIFVVIEQAGEYHGHAGAHLEVRGVHGYIDTVRYIQLIQLIFGLLAGLGLLKKMLRAVFCPLEAVSQTGECHSDYHSVLAFGDNRTVVDLDIFHVVIGEDDTGHGRKRHEDLVVLLTVLIVDVDPDLA